MSIVSKMKYKSMNKRGSSIAIYIIIGMIIVISALIYTSSKKKEVSQVIDRGTRQALSIASMRGSLQFYVTDCLKQVAMLGMNNCGVDNCDVYIKDYIKNNILKCTAGLTAFSELGFTVDDAEYEEISVESKITDDSMIINLHYPVALLKAGDATNIDNFQFQIKREATIISPDGEIPPDSRIDSTDGNARLLFDPDVPTKITDKNGDPVEEVSVSFIDKNFDGLTNSVVVGTVVYEGKPDGVTFDPCVMMEIDVEVDQIPSNFPPEDLKVGWYDYETGMWNTYRNQFGSKPKPGHPGVWTVSGCVNHLTPIAVNTCGSEEKGTYYLDLKGIFRNLIEPSDRWYWEINNPEPTGIHLLPEMMDGENCEPVSHMEYNTNCGEALFDFDNDDQINLITEPGSVNVFATQVIVETGSDTPTIRNSAKWIYYNNNVEKKKCIQVCSDYAKKKTQEYLVGSTVDFGDGDGINDKVKDLSCSITIDSSDKDDIKILEHKCANGEGTTPPSIWVYHKNNIDNPRMLDRGSELEKTMDHTEGADGVDLEGMKAYFFATPKTYGYDSIEQTGGKGTLDFEFGGDGSSCNDIEGDGSSDALAKDPETPDEEIPLLQQNIANQQALAAAAQENPEPEELIPNLNTDIDVPADLSAHIIGIGFYSNAMALNDFTVESGFIHGTTTPPIEYSETDTIIGLIPDYDDEIVFKTDFLIGPTCTDSCIYELNKGYQTTDLSGTTLMSSSHKIKTGPNTINVEVTNLGDEFDGLSEAGGVLRIEATGLISGSNVGLASNVNADRCSDKVTVQNRINYLCDCKASCANWAWDDPRGIELNCLVDYRDNFGNLDEEICDLNLGAIEYFSKGKCADVNYNDPESETYVPDGGYCSGNGDIRKGGKPVCPDLLTASDEGCVCGDNQPTYDGNNFKFCCGGVAQTEGDPANCRQGSEAIPCKDSHENIIPDGSMIVTSNNGCLVCSGGSLVPTSDTEIDECNTLIELGPDLCFNEGGICQTSKCSDGLDTTPNANSYCEESDNGKFCCKPDTTGPGSETCSVKFNDASCVTVGTCAFSSTPNYCPENQECCMTNNNIKNCDPGKITAQCFCNEELVEPNSGYCCKEGPDTIFKNSKCISNSGCQPDYSKAILSPNCDGKTANEYWCSGSWSMYCNQNSEKCGNKCGEIYGTPNCDSDTGLCKKQYCTDGVVQPFEECDTSLSTELTVGCENDWKCSADCKTCYDPSS
jgi:hypothetical protein